MVTASHVLKWLTVLWDQLLHAELYVCTRVVSGEVLVEMEIQGAAGELKGRERNWILALSPLIGREEREGDRWGRERRKERGKGTGGGEREGRREGRGQVGGEKE